MTHKLQIVFACENPDRLATFWAAALGYILEPPPEGYATWNDFADEVGIPEEARNDLAACVDPAGVGPRIFFEKYDGGKPNQRVHLDINAVTRDSTEEERTTQLDTERVRLEALGAKFYRDATGMAGEHWYEFHDPEGNWFCVQ